jgi:predicted ArsR family transcriptional regulator
LTLQEQARALGDPTRHAIFRRVAEAEQPIGIADLNQHFDLNHNAIRQHLAKLVAASLVVETTAAGTGRGRPRLLYVIAPSVEGQWGTTGSYERLSRLLVEVIRTGREPEDVGRRAADQFRIASPSGDVVADISAAMARQGFDPEVRAGRGGAEIVLHDCPFVSAALADRQTVCALHLGIAEGLADGTPGIIDELVAYDPRKADCRLRIRVAPDAQESSSPGVLSLRGRLAKR